MSNQSVDYFQPDYYHFSEDSIILANEAARLISQDTSVLDVCCGCGVVGIEAVVKSGISGVSLTGVELQASFGESFWRNVDLFIPESRSSTELINGSFADLKLDRKFDLIVSNPPYFDTRNNRLGPNEKKNRCRFFLEGSFREFIEFLLGTLCQNGVALFLIRENESYYSYLDNFSHRATIARVKSDGKTALFSMTLLNVD